MITRPQGGSNQPVLASLLKPYKGWIMLLVALTMGSGTLVLLLPQVLAHVIDTLMAGSLNPGLSLVKLVGLTLGAFTFGSLQVVMQSVVSERVARDLRTQIIEAISLLNSEYIEAMTPERLLTNLTSDVNTIKFFISASATLLISSVFFALAASVFLLWMNWKLALPVLLVLPLIGVTFFFGHRGVQKLFAEIQALVDTLNRVLSDNVAGAALVRLMDARRREIDRFTMTNRQVWETSLRILRKFTLIMPSITFLVQLATVTILVLGGRFVIAGEMSLGEFLAFNAYLTMLVVPVFVISSTVMAIGQARASYERISAVLNAQPARVESEVVAELSGCIEVDELTLSYGERQVLKNVSFTVTPGTRVAIAGPTAAGKSQLLHVMTGLLSASSGKVRYDGRRIDEYSRASFYAQTGLVFQDSQLFNLTLRENIAFNSEVDESRLAMAIETAELHRFIAGLPLGLETVLSERGTSLSGGQKQRIMLARALALRPKILFLDDFTAHVDVATEARILANLQRNYPGLTLVTITQKLAPVAGYDQIILFMEGEVLGAGTHEDLIRSIPEYGQMLRSQQSTDSNGTG